MRDYRIIAASIVVGFILHAFIMITFKKPTAGQVCVENITKTIAYKRIQKYQDRGLYIQQMCGQSGN